MIDYFSASPQNDGMLFRGNRGFLLHVDEFTDGKFVLDFLVEYIYYLAIIV